MANLSDAKKAIEDNPCGIYRTLELPGCKSYKRRKANNEEPYESAENSYKINGIVGLRHKLESISSIFNMITFLAAQRNRVATTMMLLSSKHISTINKHKFKTIGLLVIMCILSLISVPLFASVENNPKATAYAELAALEKSAGGRLSVYAINTSNNQSINYHSNQRFPLCSTSKVMVVAAILKDSEANPSLLQKTIKYKKSDLVVWSPETKKHLHLGMTINALGKAAMTLSDNTAINLIMQQLGGPKDITTFARSIGDEFFNLDRWEPELNTAIPGDSRDTSTPEAMGSSLRKLVLDNALATDQRNLLKTWLIGNKTGDTRIRAGTPQGWIVGDKTGTCAYGTTNDIGIIWPPHGNPIVLAVYYTQDKKLALPRDDVLKSVTETVLHYFFATERSYLDKHDNNNYLTL